MSKHIDVPMIKSDDLDGPESLWNSRLTLIHPFFGEAKRFELQWKNWLRYSPDNREKLDIIIVDDCGTPPVHDMITNEMKRDINFNLTVYRVLDDLKWSTPCALNLGLMAAQTSWTLIMDSDCMFDNRQMFHLLNLKPKPDIQYKFKRNRITNNPDWAKNNRYLPCTMLQHKDLFLDVGGFDEDFTGSFSGGYGSFDNHYDAKVHDAGYKLRYINTVVATEYMDDVVGARIARSKGHMNLNKNIMYDKWNGKRPNSQDMLRFKWARRFHHREFV